MSPLLPLATAAEVLVHQWIPWNPKPMPKEPPTTCSTPRGPQTPIDREWMQEPGAPPCQSKADKATSVAKAKVIHSQEVPNANVGHSRSVPEAKCNY